MEINVWIAFVLVVFLLEFFSLLKQWMGNREAIRSHIRTMEKIAAYKSNLADMNRRNIQDLLEEPDPSVSSELPIEQKNAAPKRALVVVLLGTYLTGVLPLAVAEILYSSTTHP